MRTNSFAIAQFSIKKTLSALVKTALLAVCLSTITGIAPRSAIAGDRPVAQPDSGSSGLSDTFSPHRRLLNGTAVSARISAELATVLQRIQASQSVASVAGKTLAISAEQISTIVSAVATERAETLEQQLTAEMDGLEIEIAVLDVSAQNLSSAIASTNNLVAALDSDQLISATESPTFMALLQLISSANQAVVVESTTVADKNRETVLLQMSLR